ncbi:MAG: hemagglutinin repeat-containing protein [Ottowia sp.]|uniref:hemagglutinin repeat-containing protein n=1 Tax=Ottowia sp. TaxID=1898956 RepID=UPI003C714F95
MSLSAHTIDLGAQETHASNTSRDQSSGWTAGVTYHGGTAFSFDASISTNQGRAEGQSTQQNNTHIRATEGVSFSSTGGTSLKGARIEGETVKGQVGGNLTIESLQDTATASAQQSSSGLNFSYGAQGSGSAQGTNAGANFSQGRANGSYAVVTEQSGIAAGQGGFEINVGGTTQAGIQDYVALRQQKHSLCIPILPIPLQTMLGIRPSYPWSPACAGMTGMKYKDV